MKSSDERQDRRNQGTGSGRCDGWWGGVGGDRKSKGQELSGEKVGVALSRQDKRGPHFGRAAKISNRFPASLEPTSFQRL